MTLQQDDRFARGVHYLSSTPETVFWGWLPNARSEPILSMDSGEIVVIDTVSHEGILEDQGRDPIEFFARYGVAAADVLEDAIAIAGSALAHEADDGPHVVTGPIEVRGAASGDVLRVDVLALDMRAPYGVISSRHGRGCLPGEFPEGRGRSPLASAERPELFGSVFEFVSVEKGTGDGVGVIRWPGGSARFPLRPFLGVMGVAPATTEPVSSVPPGAHGGNLDVNLLVAGTSLFLPVQVPGGLFYVGDPHFAQGDGEVALTALEAPLRATVRLSVLKSDAARSMVGPLTEPFIETPDLWVPIGLDRDLDEAARRATRNAVDFLAVRVGMPRATAYAYLSAAGDLEVSQVVDIVKGVHCCIRKADFLATV